jgi:hypothetical protein
LFILLSAGHDLKIRLAHLCVPMFIVPMFIVHAAPETLPRWSAPTFGVNTLHTVVAMLIAGCEELTSGLEPLISSHYE